MRRTSWWFGRYRGEKQSARGAISKVTTIAPERGHQGIGAVVFLGLLGVAVVGCIQQQTRPGISYDLFYLLAGVWVGWKAGRSAALGLALATGILAALLGATKGSAAVPVWLTVWNSLVRLMIVASAGWLAAELGRRDRAFDLTVQQRTAGLQREVAQHKETAQLLHEAVELFKQVTENIQDVFWVTDPTRSRMEYVSPGFERVWGESCESLYSRPSVWVERIHPEDRERVTRAQFRNQVLGNYDEEYRVVRPDGRLGWVHDRAFPVKDESGAVYRLVGIAEDITERRRTLQLLQAQRDIGLTLSSTNDLKTAMDGLLEIALGLDGIDCGGVYLLEPDTGELHLVAHRNLSPTFRERVSHYRANASEARAAQTGRSLYMREDQIPRSLEVWWGSQGLRALAAVPVRHQQGTLGMLTLASYRHEAIPPRTRMAIEMIGAQVAGAMARIRAEESLRRSEAHLRKIINSAPLALLAVDAKGMIAFEDGRGLAAMGVQAGQHLRQSALEVYADHPTMQDNVARALAGEEFTSTLEFGAAVFECHYAPIRELSPAGTGFILVAVDVTERQQLQRQILEISDREQARMGQDFHDGLCQQLIGLALALNTHHQSLRDEGAVQSSAVQKICSRLDEAISESRRVCRGLYPVRLKTEGLGPALEELAHTVSERYPVKCTCHIDPQPIRCGVAVATHLYRIAQEAINNALKHSGACSIRIGLAGNSNGLELNVQDNGQPSKTPPGRGAGMGLHIMEYRARSIGGSFCVKPGENGTNVICCVPLPFLAEPAAA